MLQNNLASFVHVGVNHYIVLGAILLSLGVLGVLIRRNALVILMCIELMLNAVNLNFVAFAKYGQNIDGQIMVFFVMTIAAAEAAVGLAIAVNIYKRFKDVNISRFEHMKG